MDTVTAQRVPNVVDRDGWTGVDRCGRSNDEGWDRIVFAGQLDAVVGRGIEHQGVRSIVDVDRHRFDVGTDIGAFLGSKVPQSLRSLVFTGCVFINLRINRLVEGVGAGVKLDFWKGVELPLGPFVVWNEAFGHLVERSNLVYGFCQLGDVARGMLVSIPDLVSTHQSLDFDAGSVNALGNFTGDERWAI